LRKLPVIEIKSNKDNEPCLTAVMPLYNEATTVTEAARVRFFDRNIFPSVHGFE